MKQYVPIKPVKRGFKVWVSAESNTGYILDVNVYVGKLPGAPTEHGLGERVVLQLSQPLTGKRHQIFCDNFFTSPTLFQELLRRQLYACGTVRQDRIGFPNDLKGVHLERGESQFRQIGNLTATIWQDKKQVSVLSTCTQPGETQNVYRRQRDGNRTLVPCPTPIVTYNQNMGGVDRADQMRKYYGVRLKCNKNYKYIFWFIFDVCITNAFVLTKFCVTIPSSNDDSRLKQFRIKLAKALIGSYNGRERIGRPRLPRPHPPDPLVGPAHFPKHQSRKRCVYCNDYRNPGTRKESVWYCGDCENSPTLCLTGKDDGSDCWRLWHSTN